MKKKFNIYCGLLIAAIVFGIGVDMAQTGYMAFRGAQAGWEQASREKNGECKSKISQTIDINDLNAVEMFPKNIMQLDKCDSIINKKTGEKMPVMMTQAIVFTKERPPLANPNKFTSWFMLGLIIAFWVVFIKLVKGVNKGEIFEKKTENYLSWGGWLCLAIYMLGWVERVWTYYNNVQMFEFENYDTILYEGPDSAMLYAAFGMLLVGQIFKIGRQMKEEQELTV